MHILKSSKILQKNIENLAPSKRTPWPFRVTKTWTTQAYKHGLRHRNKVAEELLNLSKQQKHEQHKHVNMDWGVETK